MASGTSEDQKRRDRRRNDEQDGAVAVAAGGEVWSATEVQYGFAANATTRRPRRGEHVSG